MKGQMRIIRMIVLGCFMVNMAFPAVSFGQAAAPPGTSPQKLSAPLMTDSLIGIQHKDIGRIKMALEAQLEAIAEESSGESMALDDFTKAAHKKRTIQDESIYIPAEMQFFFSEAVPVQGGVRVTCRIKDSYGTRNYYVVFSLTRDEEAGFPIKGIYTEKEYMAFDELAKLLPSRPDADEAAIERYIRHEKGIDALIRYAAETDQLIKHEDRSIMDIPGAVQRLTQSVKVRISNPEGLIPIGERDVYLVKLTPETKKMLTDNPVAVVNEAGRETEIVPQAHASNSAVYFFVDEGEIDDFYSTKKFQRNLLHEIGVMCGLPVKEVSGGVVYNDMSLRWREYDRAGRLVAEPVTYGLVNLDTRLLTRDYTIGVERMDEESYARHVDAAWQPADRILAEPFSAEAQAALARIIELNLARMYSGVRITSEPTLYKTVYAMIFVAHDYKGVMRLVENAARDPEMNRIMMDHENTHELYYLAAMLDEESIREAAVLREDFFDHFSGKLFGPNNGKAVFNGMMGSLYGRTGPEVKTSYALYLAEMADIMIHSHMERGEYMQAARTAGNFAGFLKEWKKAYPDQAGDVDLYLTRFSAAKDTAEAMTIADRAGEDLPTHPDTRYTLIMTSEFFANRELEAHRARYADRFELESVSAGPGEHTQFIDKVLALTRGREDKAIALVPDDIPAGQLRRLTDAGIRFLRTDTGALLESKAEKDPDRAMLQQNTYAAMLLARDMKEDMDETSPIYRLLEFYLKSQFRLDEVSAGEYIQALVSGNIAVLVKGILSFRPAAPYVMPDHNTVAATLIAA